MVCITLSNKTTPRSNGWSVVEKSGILDMIENESLFEGPKMGHSSSMTITLHGKLQKP
jgi:hypothetical protein